MENRVNHEPPLTGVVLPASRRQLRKVMGEHTALSGVVRYAARDLRGPRTVGRRRNRSVRHDLQQSLRSLRVSRQPFFALFVEERLSARAEAQTHPPASLGKNLASTRPCWAICLCGVSAASRRIDSGHRRLRSSSPEPAPAGTRRILRVPKRCQPHLGVPFPVRVIRDDARDVVQHERE